MSKGKSGLTDTKNALAAIRPAIFQIALHTRQPSTTGQMPAGTAFAVSIDGYLVTALHVITGCEEAIAKLPAGTTGTMFAMFAGPNVDTAQVKIRASFTGQPFTVVARDPDNDIALLKLKAPLSTFSLRIGPDMLEAKPVACSIDTGRPEEGEPVAISGYPLGEAALVTNFGHIASSWAWDTNRQDRYLGDITGNPGNSGGPVYRLSDGKVIGLHVATRTTNTHDALGQPHPMMQNAGLTVVIPAIAISNLLAANRAKAKETVTKNR